LVVFGYNLIVNQLSYRVKKFILIVV
jgi:hypothetical protein